MIDEFRMQAGVTKSHLCKSIGVDPKTYNAWVEGAAAPNLVRAVRLARFFHQPIHTICVALNMDMKDIPVETANSIPEQGGDSDSDRPESCDVAVVSRMLLRSSPEDLEAFLRILLSLHANGEPLVKAVPHDCLISEF